METTISKPTRATVCDLCGEEIDTSSSRTEWGHLLSRSADRAPTAKTKHSWMTWFRPNPPGTPAYMKQEVKFDFHGSCIYSLVSEAVNDKKIGA